MLYFYSTIFDIPKLLKSLSFGLDRYRVLEGRYVDVKTVVMGGGGVSIEIVEGVAWSSCLIIV